jgi:hypothetical protein
MPPWSKAPTGTRGNQSEMEVVPDAWERFRGAVHTMTQAGPQHRTSAEKPKSKAERVQQN